MRDLRERVRKNWSAITVLVFVFCSMLYILIAGQYGLYVPVHDNLDSHNAWFKMMKDNGLFWGFEQSSLPFLGGINRYYFYSGLKLQSIIYWIFPAFFAYVIIGYIRIALSVIGAFFLGKTLIKDEYNKTKHIFILTGFIYGILPISPILYLGIAYLPFLLYFLIQFNRKPSIKIALGILVYILLSDFVYFGVFICGYLLFYIIFRSIKTRKIYWEGLLLLVAFSLTYVIIEWRLFYIMLFSGNKTIRETMSKGGQDLMTVVKNIYSVFKNSQYHADALQGKVVLPVCICYCITANIYYLVKRQYKMIFKEKVNIILCVIIFNCVIFGLDEYTPFLDMLAAIFPPIRGLSMARTHFFNPFLWYFAFAIVLYKIYKLADWTKVLSYLLVAFCSIVIALSPTTYNHIYFNLRQIATPIIKGHPSSELTYGEFYSEELFEEIKADIHYNNEWSVAFGMHPAVIEYNGIHSLDGYVSYYPESYKQQFRKIIAPDFEKDISNREYYDSWGGRAYIFSNEIGYEPERNMANKANLRIDTEAFKQLGGKYIFSRVEVINKNELHIAFVGKYENSLSPYTIFVYQVDE